MIVGSELIAHQGGWDEILLVGVPIVVIAGLLAVAKRRVDAIADARDGDDDERESSSRADAERPAH